VTGQPFFPTTDDLIATGPRQAALHERAVSLTRARFGSQVFVRAVVEISNFCRENCAYCGMRRAHRALARYRASVEELAALLLEHRPPSVTDVNLQAGEDPVAARQIALPLIRLLRRETPLGISVCLGTLDPALYAELRNAGASIYIMKFELADPRKYEQFEAPGTLSQRLRHIRELAAAGWHVSSGFIAGLPGESAEDLLGALALARELPLRGCSVSPFIPGEATPLSRAPMGKSNLTLNCMAALRLMRPDWVIPAVSALNLAEPGCGYRRGLRAGANLVTINLTPPAIRGNYLLYRRDRFIMTEARILAAIEAEGLTPSRQSLADFWSASGSPGEAMGPRPDPVANVSAGGAIEPTCQSSDVARSGLLPHSVR
jgi:biotin synthase